jgi:hypothetical protein
MTFRLAHPGFSMLEQEFSEEYFNGKRDSLCRQMQGEKRLIIKPTTRYSQAAHHKADYEVQPTSVMERSGAPKVERCDKSRSL